MLVLIDLLFFDAASAGAPAIVATTTDVLGYDLAVRGPTGFTSLIGLRPDGGYGTYRVSESAPTFEHLDEVWFVVAAVDLDGDGSDELLANAGDGTLLEATSGGPIAIEGRGADGRFPCAPTAAGDWNGDGRADLASRAAVWTSDGTNLALVARIGDYGERDCLDVAPVVLGDVDGDGADDLLVYTYAPDLPRPRTESGGGSPDDRTWGGRWSLFATSDRRDAAWLPRWTVGSDTHPVIDAVAPVDIDRDGAPELAAYLEDGGDGTTSGVGELVLLGDLASASGPRELARGALLRVGGFAWGAGTYPRLLPVGDWDGDGDDDVLVETTTLSPVERFVLDADLDGVVRVVDALVLRELLEGEQLPDLYTWPVVADVSGDGAPDVVYAVLEDGYFEATAFRAWFTGPGRDFPTALVAATTIQGTQQGTHPDSRGCAHAPGMTTAALLAAWGARRARSGGVAYAPRSPSAPAQNGEPCASVRT